MDKALLRVGEAADFLSVSRWTIYRWVEEGRLRGTKVGKGSLRIFRESIAGLVQNNQIEKAGVLPVLPAGERTVVSQAGPVRDCVDQAAGSDWYRGGQCPLYRTARDGARHYAYVPHNGHIRWVGCHIDHDRSESCAQGHSGKVAGRRSWRGHEQRTLAPCQRTPRTVQRTAWIVRSTRSTSSRSSMSCECHLYLFTSDAATNIEGFIFFTESVCDGQHG